MRIVLATPLYPPDLGDPAHYVKELVRRLGHTHQITVLAYTRYPEQVRGVTIVPVNKRLPTPLRVFLFTVRLFFEAARHDVVYAENGISVEFPTLISSLILGKHTVLHLGDARAEETCRQSSFRMLVRSLLAKRVHAILKDSPPNKPERIPHTPPPDSELRVYEERWEKHIELLDSHMT